MPTLKDFAGFRIMMHIGDHNPPHVHVIAGAGRATVTIREGTIIAGRVPPKVLRRARAWIAANRAASLLKWDKLHG